MGRIYNPDDFIIQYPGVYEGAAKKAMDDYFAMLNEVNSTEVTGEDVAVGRVKEPKLAATLTITENMMRFCAEKYAPDYAPLHDAGAAKKLGYEDIFAMPGLSACDDVFTLPTPAEARDTLLVSQICHDIRTFNPIYPGDTIYMIRDRTDVTDHTDPKGSIYRHLYQIDLGTVYNQRGQVVAKVSYATMESLKVYKPDRLPKPKEKFGFGDMWEDPDWFARPEHIYTDADYEKFKEIWRNEPDPSKQSLTWSDIQVGGSFPMGCYGPIFEGVTPTKPYGMGIGGCRNLKKELLDPEIAKDMVKDERTGIWKSADPEVNVPATPDGVKPFFLAPPDEEEAPSGEINTAEIHSGANTRSALINFMGRDIAVGHIMNCVGYGGKIRRVQWSIMSPETHAALGKPVPVMENFKVFTREVPGQEDNFIPIHGLTNDVALVRTYVAKKYLDNNVPVVDVVFWNEDIEGRTWITGKVEIEMANI